MNKVPILSLIGLLGYNIATTDLAFAQNDIIKFGKQGELTYEVSPRPYDEHRHERTIEQRIGQNWGQFYINKSGEFILWGVLDGKVFVYNPGVLADSLTLIVDGISVEFYDQPNNQSIGRDSARIDGIHVPLESSNFYESPGLNKPWDKMDLIERLHHLFSTYTKYLNIGAIKAKAQKVRESITPEQLRKSLDVFKLK